MSRKQDKTSQSEWDERDDDWSNTRDGKRDRSKNNHRQNRRTSEREKYGDSRLDQQDR